MALFRKKTAEKHVGRKNIMKKSKHNLIFSFLILVIMISLTSCAHVHSRDEGSWVVDMEPTCTKTGTKQLVCSCGVILETDVVPARVMNLLTEFAKSAMEMQALVWNIHSIRTKKPTAFRAWEPVPKPTL